MTMTKRKLKRFLLIVLTGMAIVAVGATMWLYQSMAPITGTYEVAGLDDSVTITFDPYERPFVRAKSLDDALFAEGWLHAHHRLWQMEMFRRAGTGRLSEMLGNSMLESDKELWRMGVPQLARQLEANASATTIAHVAAYVKGINAEMAGRLDCRTR